MSVATELQRIIDAKADLKTAIEAKGVTVSSSALIDDYADYVDAIPSGGGGAVEEKLLNFYDYDGTLVASYEESEISGLTALPDAPDHSSDIVPLTFDEWNWTLAEIKAYNTSYPGSVIVVGANYHTTDGKTHFFFNVTSNSDGNGVYVTIDSSGSGTVDWGDGSSENLVNDSSKSHIYSNAGLYHCVFDGTFTYLHSSSTIKTNSKLVRVFYSSAITQINNSAFSDNYNICSISLPKGITTIGQSCFGNCYSLNCLVLPKGITTINTSTASYCYSLKILALPSSITSIANNAFEYNTSLRYVTLPSGLTSLGAYPFRYCYSLNQITIPSGITSIGEPAYYNCYSLQKVSIPSSVTSIASESFRYCKSLQSVIIPSGVTSIGSRVFDSCSSLYSVTILATTPPTLSNSNAFSTSNQKKFYVPYSADHSILDAYKTAQNWSNYASYMEELPE
jgi:hypothetical protein